MSKLVVYEINVMVYFFFCFVNQHGGNANHPQQSSDRSGNQLNCTFSFIMIKVSSIDLQLKKGHQIKTTPMFSLDISKCLAFLMSALHYTSMNLSVMVEGMPGSIRLFLNNPIIHY